MRVVLAPGPFRTPGRPSLPAGAVGRALADGWHDAAPGDDLEVVPLSTGDSGFVAAVQASVGGRVTPMLVTGPLGEPVPASLLLAGPPGDRTAYVEAAEACGLHLLAQERRDPTLASSYGVGELVDAAVRSGASRVVVGVGGTAGVDGGAGLLAALGAGPVGALGRGGLALAAVQPADLAGLAAVRDRLGAVELVLAAASDIGLLGFHGASATRAAAKGASPEQAQELERALGHYADLATRSLVAGRPLPGHERSSAPAARPGAGAGGGIGFALHLLGATYVSGVRAVAEAAGLAARVGAADLVVGAEATFDWESLTGGVVPEVAATGLAAGVPAIVVAGQVLVGRREAMTLGLAGSYAVAERPEQLAEALADPVAALRARSARVARTWSRP